MSSSRTGNARGRRADRTGRHPADLPAVTAVAVLVLAVLALWLAGTAARTASEDTQGTQGTQSTEAAARPSLLVDRTLLACPDTAETAGPGGDLQTTVAAGLADIETSLGDGQSLGVKGRLTVGPLGQEGSDQAIAPGELVGVPAEPAPVLDGAGAAAPGLFGYRTDRTTRGIAVARCAEPGGSWWFTGAGAGLDHSSHLVLANLDPGPAVVDVVLSGPDGPVETLGTRGIPIDPGESATIPMTELAPQTEELLVEVEASQGRVAAAILDRYAPTEAATPGVEWLPAAERAGRDLRLVGLAARASTYTLLVANPSDRQALVEIQLAGSAATFTPAGLDEVSVAPGSVESVDLTDVVPAETPVAVRVRSNVALVASVRSVGSQDTSYAGPAAALLGPASVPVVEDARTTLEVTAGPQPARVRLAGYTRAGELTGRDKLSLDAGATAGWEPEQRTAYVVVFPLTGSVSGAATYAGSRGVAQTPLVGSPLSVVIPRVIPGPG